MAGLYDLSLETLENIIKNIPRRPFGTKILLLNKTLCRLFMIEQVRNLNLTEISVLQQWIAVITKEEENLGNKEARNKYTKDLRYCNFLDKISELRTSPHAFSDIKTIERTINRYTNLRKLILDGKETSPNNNVENAILNYLPSNIIELQINELSIGDKYMNLLEEYLKRNTKLSKLHLSTNGIQVEGGRTLGKYLNPTITELSLANNSIGYEGARALAENLKQNSTLITLDLYCNNIGYDGIPPLAKSLKLNITLTNLNLGCNFIGDRGVYTLVESLNQNITLTNLNLSWNQIRDGGIIELAKYLKQNTTLVSLNLYGNNISGRGTYALAESLKQNITLTNLNLGRFNLGNNISVEGVQALAKALKQNTTLTNLNLEYNKIGAEGAHALAEALEQNTALTNLNLGGNHIGNIGARALAAILSLKQNTTLISLIVSANNIGFDGAYLLTESVKQNKAFTYLDISCNPFLTLGEQNAKGLARGLKRNMMLTHPHIKLVI